ncbi:putative odorant receptor 69a [Achroia grisella]|uniref:putative odorant receptor 69a n=1 Tax=Achroia grisella TaxID=688607 RepID=UPI0027D271B2|nr:putative odorant receptor 69a [Achroia grisella]
MMSNTAPVDRPRRYFYFHFVLLRFLGLGWWHQPDEEDTRNFPNWYIYYSILTQLVWVAGFVGLETIDPFFGEKDLDRFMFSLSFVITHDLTLIKLYIFFFKNNEIQDIVRTLEIDLYQYYQNNKKNHATIRTTKIMSSAFIFFGWLTIGNTNVYGTIQDLRWKAEVAELNDTSVKPLRTLPQPIYIPWNYQTDSAYISTFVLETVGLLWTGHIVMSIDTFIGSVILHMSSQFSILSEAVMTAYNRTMLQLYDGVRQDVSEISVVPEVVFGDIKTADDVERFVRRRYSEKDVELALQNTIRNCFKQHQLLISCVEKFRQTYSYGFMTQLLSSMAAICVVMVQVSQDASSFKSIRLATSLAFFVAMIIQLAIQCFTGNELTLQAAKVADAVMQSKWERMPPRLRRHLILMMMRAHRPLRLTAAGFAYMNNDCFLAIMKAAYSYYAVLSQKQV